MIASLILASGSPFKRQLLSRLGLTFESVAADIEESDQAGESPAETARRLARQKARDVQRRHPATYVIGSDQTISLDGERFSKPHTVDNAIAQLCRLSGRTHRLDCSVAVMTPDGRLLDETVSFEMEMRTLSERTIRQYVELDRPLACAGAYKIEEAGIRLFRAMRGDDYTAIIGLPLTRVWNILEAVDYFTRSQSED